MNSGSIFLKSSKKIRLQNSHSRLFLLEDRFWELGGLKFVERTKKKHDGNLEC